MCKEMTRLGLFVFYDSQGIVDDYVVHLLQHFRPHFSKLVVISNGALNEIAKNRLTQYADSLFVRENYGLDAAAYKAGLISFCGWDEVETYDEVILINDTFYGPVHSFDDMFEEMSGRDLDFWGMSAGYHALDGWNRVKYGYMPDHIQTFFIAFRKKMVCTNAFHDYWNNYDDTLNDFVSVVSQNEVILTKHFQDLGFHWEVYADTQRYLFKNLSETFNLYHYLPHTMMREMNFPILKKKTLNIDFPFHLSMQDLESAAEAMDYVRRQTDYDTRMIWDNALRLYNISDLYHSLHLNYVLPSVEIPLPQEKRIALVFRVGNPHFAEQFCKKAAEISKHVDVYMIAEEPEAAQIIQQHTKQVSGITILNASNQKTEMGTFVLCCKDLAMQYDYLGFVHDADNPDYSAAIIAESSVYGYLQNIANDPSYISQIIHCFEQEHRLGVLGAPFPVHDYGFGNYANMWGNCYHTLTALSDQLNLNCKISEDKPPFMIVGAFWCRTAAIREIWNKEWTLRDFSINPVTCSSKTNNALVRLLPYAAQSARYYSGIVMHTNYASMRLTSQQHMLVQITDTLHTQLGIVPGRYRDYHEQLSRISYKDTDNSLSINLSDLSMAVIIRIYLERKFPQWVSKRAFRCFRFLENHKHRK